VTAPPCNADPSGSPDPSRHADASGSPAATEAADGGAGRTVLLVHGQPGAGADWAAVAARLPRSLGVLAPTRPGYDGSPARSMADNAALLADMLASAGGVPGVVVGHSYGGGIALLLAASHPELVAGLVLVAPVGDPASIMLVDRVLAAPIVGPAVTAAVLGASAWIGPRLRRLAGSGLPRPFTHVSRLLPDEQAAAALADRNLRQSFVAEQRSLVAELPSVVAAAPEVRAPAVLLVGSRDSIVPAKAVARLAATLPRAELRVVARAGHFLLHDHPSAVAAAIGRLHRGLPPAAGG
jgi:2-hydroxy-6-oxonona-2,4-dienedioate hydrolase